MSLLLPLYTTELASVMLSLSALMDGGGENESQNDHAIVDSYSTDLLYHFKRH
jgi:hypothetical protein